MEKSTARSRVEEVTRERFDRSFERFLWVPHSRTGKLSAPSPFQQWHSQMRQIKLPRMKSPPNMICRTLHANWRHTPLRCKFFHAQHSNFRGATMASPSSTWASCALQHCVFEFSCMKQTLSPSAEGILGGWNGAPREFPALDCKQNVQGCQGVRGPQPMDWICDEWTPPVTWFFGMPSGE